MGFSSDYFNLENWKLTLPVDSKGGTSGGAYEVLDLIGFESAEHFYDGPGGTMVFSASTDGSTTGGSKYPRSELREMNGEDRAAWTLKEGGTMTATVAVNEVPTRSDGKPGRLIVGQIHGEDEELVRLYWENGTVYFMNDQAGPDKEETRFDFKDSGGKTPSIGIDEKFSYKIDARGDTLTVTIYADGKEYVSESTLHSVWQSDTFYFKAGVYLGVNESSGSGVGTVSFYGLDFSHVAGQGLGGLDDGGTTTPPPTETDPDTLVGTDGNDVFNVDSAVTKVVEKANGGWDTVKASIASYALPDEVEGLQLTGDRFAKGIGNAKANVITANGVSSHLFGMGGEDLLFGGAGSDRLDGGTGADRMEGGGGTDVYYVDHEDDVVVEVGSSVDGVYASVDYTLPELVEHLRMTGDAITGKGNAERNVITGNAADNKLWGYDGADRIGGGDGDDVIVGGAGADLVIGGAGADRFVFADGDFETARLAGMDTIADFDRAEGDKIDLSAVGTGAAEGFTFIGRDGFSGVAGELRFATLGGSTFIAGDTNGDGRADVRIQLTGAYNLQASDFVL